jgi:hypothetical protein
VSFVAVDPQGHEGQTNVWLTPRWILSALGDFNLDPAAHESWPTADEHLYEFGLEEEWHGRVWLNPPYGRNIGQWLLKLQKHGNGIALVFARTDTSWFQSLEWDAANFMKGRIKFLRPSGKEETNAGTPNVLLAWGKENVKALKNVPGIICFRG